MRCWDMMLTHFKLSLSLPPSLRCRHPLLTITFWEACHVFWVSRELACMAKSLFFISTTRWYILLTTIDMCVITTKSYLVCFSRNHWSQPHNYISSHYGQNNCLWVRLTSCIIGRLRHQLIENLNNQIPLIFFVLQHYWGSQPYHVYYC